MTALDERGERTGVIPIRSGRSAIRAGARLGCVLFVIHVALGAAANPPPRPAAEQPNTSEPASIDAKVLAEVGTYVDTDSVSVLTPSVTASLADASRGWTANGSYLVDVVSAASVDIVSTASPRWTEVRHAGHLDAAFRPRDVGVGATAAISSEPDYLSASGGGRLFLSLVERSVTPQLAYSYTHDTAGRVGTPFSVYSQQLIRHAVSASVELVVDPRTKLQLEGAAFLERGDQKKPYRLLPVFDASVADQLPRGASLALVNRLRLPGRMAERTPGERNRFVIAGRMARRYDGASLRIGQRLYADDWGLFASTVDARVAVGVGRRWSVWLGARGHLQSGVAFWRRAYVARVDVAGTTEAPEYRTGDRELGPLYAGTVGPAARYAFGPASAPESWALTLQADTTATHFLDSLFVRDRLAELIVLQVEASP